jgi:hypothetical protein
MSNYDIYVRITTRWDAVSTRLAARRMMLRQDILVTPSGREFMLPDTLYRRFENYVYARRGKLREIVADIAEWGNRQTRNPIDLPRFW